MPRSDEGQRCREDRARTEAVQCRSGPHRLDARRERAHQRTEDNQYCAAEDQLAVAKLVAKHAEGQLEYHHRNHERGGDPRQLRTERVEGQLEFAVERAGKGVGDLRHHDGQGSSCRVPLARACTGGAGSAAGG